MTSTPMPDERPAVEEKQHTSGDLARAEDAPAADEPPVTEDAAAIDESLPFDAAEEAGEKWWESRADATDLDVTDPQAKDPDIVQG